MCKLNLELNQVILMTWLRCLKIILVIYVKLDLILVIRNLLLTLLTLKLRILITLVHWMLLIISSKKLNKYSMVPSRVCVNCGAICQNDQLRAGPFRYCSKVCYRERPPALVRIEYNFKTDVRTVLQISLQLFKSLKLISNVLQISRAHLLKIYEQYLNIRPHEFGADVLDLIDLLRRSTPAPSIDSFIILDPAKARKFPKWLEHEEACRLLAARL